MRVLMLNWISQWPVIGGNTIQMMNTKKALGRKGHEVKVGLLDSSHFLYEEDADYSLRIVRSGIRTVFAPSIVLFHESRRSDKTKHVECPASHLANLFGIRYSLALLAAHGSMYQKIGRAYFLLLLLLPWRIFLNALSHRMLVRPTLWGIIAQINPSKFPPDDIMVVRLISVSGRPTKRDWQKRRYP